MCLIWIGRKNWLVVGSGQASHRKPIVASLAKTTSSTLSVLEEVLAKAADTSKSSRSLGTIVGHVGKR